MTNRLASPQELPEIMKIIAEAKDFMKSSGLDQWQDGYPDEADFIEDIENGVCHVFLDKNKIVGVVAICFEPETCYGYVEGGKWLTSDVPYAVFHRAAVGSEYRNRGIAGQMLSYAAILAKEKGFSSLRGDTHRDNKAMRNLLDRMGFVHCGTIYLEDGRNPKDARVCYEKLLEK